MVCYINWDMLLMPQDFRFGLGYNFECSIEPIADVLKNIKHYLWAQRIVGNSFKYALSNTILDFVHVYAAGRDGAKDYAWCPFLLPCDLQVETKKIT